MRRVACVGALITDASGRLLVVRRGRPPGIGLWSVPGGRVEPGESDAQALRREVREETGLDVVVQRFVGRVQRPGLPTAADVEVVYDIADYRCAATGGQLRAGDDASDARWVTPGELRGLPVTAGLVEALEGWGVLSA